MLRTGHTEGVLGWLEKFYFLTWWVTSVQNVCLVTQSMHLYYVVFCIWFYSTVKDFKITNKVRRTIAMRLCYLL